MTRPATNYRDRRRELARELADVPAPPPPADLLDAIRDEIPADLAVAERACPRSPDAHGGGRPALPLAASIAFVAFGALVVLRTHRPSGDPEQPERSHRPVAGVVTETRRLERLGSPARESVEGEVRESCIARESREGRRVGSRRSPGARAPRALPRRESPVA